MTSFWSSSSSSPDSSSSMSLFISSESSCSSSSEPVTSSESSSSSSSSSFTIFISPEDFFLPFKVASWDMTSFCSSSRSSSSPSSSSSLLSASDSETESSSRSSSLTILSSEFPFPAFFAFKAASWFIISVCSSSRPSISSRSFDSSLSEHTSSSDISSSSKSSSLMILISLDCLLPLSSANWAMMAFCSSSSSASFSTVSIVFLKPPLWTCFKCFRVSIKLWAPCSSASSCESSSVSLSNCSLSSLSDANSSSHFSKLTSISVSEDNAPLAGISLTSSCSLKETLFLLLGTAKLPFSLVDLMLDL